MSTSELSVCTTCFSLTSLGLGMQSCRCEEYKAYEGVDCPSGYHLCHICAVGLAGGTSRWAWNACEPCLKFNRKLAKEYGFSLPLGRHSVMNSISISMAASEQEQERATKQMIKFLQNCESQEDWAVLRARTLFESVPSWRQEKLISLAMWQGEFHVSKVKTAARTVQAFKEYLRVDGFEELVR